MSLSKQLKSHADFSKLNNEQQDFCKLACEGWNIFLSGSAGVGKSFCTKFLCDFLDSQDVSYGKTALTGIAALNIGGSTIHSWAGIGLGTGDFDEIMKWVWRNKKATGRIRSAKLLLIDEISMASARIVDLIDRVFKKVRGDNRPFGGIQVVLCGDFFQLQPVFSANDLEQNQSLAFESAAWSKANVRLVELTKIIRQDHESEFAKVLNEIRVGNTSNIKLIKDRIGVKLPRINGSLPVRIFAHNKVVEAYNKKVFAVVPGAIKAFWCKDTGESKHSEFFDKNCKAPKKLELKIEAQVSLCFNIDTEGGLVNGLVGKVKGFVEGYPEVHFVNGVKSIIQPECWELKEQVTVGGKIKYRVVATRTQVPLRLNWASTVHSNQGVTLEAVSVDLSAIFGEGMGYSALSRVKSIEGLSILRDFDESRIVASQKCLDFYRNQKVNK